MPVETGLVKMDLKLACNALSVMKVIAERDKGDQRTAC